MPTVLRLHVSGSPDQGWRLTLDDGGGRPVEGAVSVEAVRSVIAEVAGLLAARPGVVLPGRDAARTRAEEDVGRALAGLLRVSPALVGRLGWALGSAHGRGEVPVLVVDAMHAEARELPWELLADPTDGQPLEPGNRCVIARLAPVARAALLDAEEPLAPLVWCPTPDDPACRARLATVGPLLAALGDVRTLDPGGLPPSDVRRALLHVVCHGERLSDEVRLLLGDQDLAVGTAAHALGPVLARCAAVVLDVCDGGHPGVGESDTLAGRFLAAGAGACVAPLRRTSVQAAARFSEGFDAAVAEGATLVEAVAAGRRGVRALGVALPESRWCNHALWVGHVAALADGPLARRAWRPEGWSAPSPTVAQLLDRAAGLARTLHSGFVGVEHLALAAAEGQSKGFLAGRVRALLSRRTGVIREMLGAWLPTGLPEDPGGTPRLRALGARLPGGVGEEALWGALIADGGSTLLDVCGLDGLLGAADLEVTLRSLASADPDADRPLARALEVAAGPEDGRALEIGPHEMVGRATPGSLVGHALYGATAVSDRRLSRAHLRWLAEGRVEALRPLRRHRAGRVVAFPSGEVEVRAGDLLQLGGSSDGAGWAGTWLRAR